MPLEHGLEESFQGLAHVGPGVFHFRHHNGEEYKTKVGFTHTPRDVVESSTVLDLDTAKCPQYLEQSKSCILKFLNQFEDIQNRGRNKHEEGTFLLIAGAARYQKELLAPYTRIPAEQRDEATLIATMLRCFVMTDDIFAVEVNWSCLIDLIDNEVHELRPEAHSEYWGLESAVTVQRLPKSSGRRSIEDQVRKYPQGLPATLKKAIGTLQQVMFKRRPQDIPCLIYSLALLDLITHSLKPSAKFMSPIAEAGNNLLDILKTLCDLCIFCSKGVHPLSEDSDISKYEALVDKDAAVVEEFRAMNKMWKDLGIKDGDVSDKGFYSRIDGFAYSMLWD